MLRCDTDAPLLEGLVTSTTELAEHIWSWLNTHAPGSALNDISMCQGTNHAGCAGIVWKPLGAQAAENGSAGADTHPDFAHPAQAAHPPQPFQQRTGSGSTHSSVAPLLSSATSSDLTYRLSEKAIGTVPPLDTGLQLAMLSGADISSQPPTQSSFFFEAPFTRSVTREQASLDQAPHVESPLYSVDPLCGFLGCTLSGRPHAVPIIPSRTRKSNHRPNNHPKHPPAMLRRISFHHAESQTLVDVPLHELLSNSPTQQLITYNYSVLAKAYPAYTLSSCVIQIRSKPGLLEAAQSVVRLILQVSVQDQYVSWRSKVAKESLKWPHKGNQLRLCSSSSRAWCRGFENYTLTAAGKVRGDELRTNVAC